MANFSHLQPCSALVVPCINPKITSKAWRHSTRKALWHVLSWLCLRVLLPCFWACWVWRLGLAAWHARNEHDSLCGRIDPSKAREGGGGEPVRVLAMIHIPRFHRFMVSHVAGGACLTLLHLMLQLQVALPSCYVHLNIALYDVTFSQTSCRILA